MKVQLLATSIVVGAVLSPCSGDIIDFEDTNYPPGLTPAAIWDDEYVSRGVTNFNPDGAAGYILPFVGINNLQFIAPHSGNRAVYVNTGVFAQPSFQAVTFAQPQQFVTFWIAISEGDRVGVRVGDPFGQQTDLDQSIVVVPGQWTQITIQSSIPIISTVIIGVSNQGNVSYAPWALDDFVFIVPAPGSAGALMAGALLLCRRRR